MEKAGRYVLDLFQRLKDRHGDVFINKASRKITHFVPSWNSRQPTSQTFIDSTVYLLTTIRMMLFVCLRHFPLLCQPCVRECCQVGP